MYERHCGREKAGSSAGSPSIFVFTATSRVSQLTPLLIEQGEGFEVSPLISAGELEAF